MQGPANVFDLDNTLLDTEGLKADMPWLCHRVFPDIAPRMFTDAYESYKAAHEGW